MTFEEAVRAGQPYEPGIRKADRIDGDRLRNLFLGIERKTWPITRKTSEPVAPRRNITAAGVVIRGTKTHPLQIYPSSRPGRDGMEVIDLSYLAGPNGGPLPPLVLSHCIIPSKLLLTGSHFAFLSMEDCLITQIDADQCQIDNHCRMIRLSPVLVDGAEPIAQIRMVGSRIRGTTDLRGCRLRAPVLAEKPDASRHHADRYALSLSSAELSGRVLLDHGFEALGGVSLYQAVILNSLSLNTARLESRRHDIPALDGEDLRLTGSLLWVNEPSAYPWHIAGRMVLRRAELGSDMKLEHCRWAAAGAESLAGGAKVDHLSGGIDARACNVAGQLRIGEGCVVGRWKGPPSRRATEDVASGVYGASLDAWKAFIGKGVRIEGGNAPAQFRGPIFLNDSKIEHGLIMLGEVNLPQVAVATEKIAEALDLSDARISGLVRMRCKLSGSLIFRRCQIDGTVELQDLRFRRPTLLPGDCRKDCKDGKATLLDLSSVSVSGSVHLGGFALAEDPRSVWKLLNNAGSLAELGQAEKAPANEFLVHPRIAVRFAGENGEGQLITGDAEQLRQVFAVNQPVATESAIREFVAFYFENVVDDLGDRAIGDIPPAVQTPDGWRLMNFEYAFSGDWHRADLHISRDYRITLRHERQIARNDPVERECAYRMGPFKFLAEQAAWRTLPVTEDVGRRLKALSNYADTHAARPMIIDLRGLTCRTFDDNDAEIWELAHLGDQREWRLLLDGIDFSQLDHTDPKERSKEYRARRERRSGTGGNPSPAVAKEDSEPAPARHGVVDGAAKRTRARSQERRRRRHMLHAFVPGQRVKRWRHTSHPALDEQFSPQPFEIFARAYARSGDHSMAETIISAQKRLQWRHMSRVNRESIATRWPLIAALAAGAAVPFAFLAVFATGHWPGLSFHYSVWAAFLSLWFCFYLTVKSWPWVLITVGWLFDACFRFGLRPAIAIQTLMFCLLGGTAAVGALSVEIFPVPRHHPAPLEEKAGASKEGFREIGRAILPADVAVEGCNVVSGSLVDRALYAVDVFVPLIDFRQECGFTIKREAYWVRLMKAFYAALGWVVVSLTLLTISGVLRRDIEK